MKSVLRFAVWPLVFVIILWIIEGLSDAFNFRLFMLGVIPRTISGIPGILLSPFIHGSYEHLLSNSMPLLVVGTGMLYFYREIAWRVIAMVWVFTGFWVWLLARDSSHVGASGIIYGLVCFLFFSGVFRRDTRLMAVSMLVVFLYGSMVWGLLPVDQSISWESHLFGSIAGIFCAVYFRREGPQRPKAQFEIDEENERLNALNPNNELHSERNDDHNLTINYHYTEKKEPTEGEENKQ